MAYSRAAFTLKLNGQALVLSAVTEAGTAVVVYSDAALTSAVTLPATVSSDTTYYVDMVGRSARNLLLTITEQDGTDLSRSVPISERNNPLVVEPVPSERQIAADVGSRSATWQANTAYKAGEIVVNNSLTWQANADFTSGASFNASNWTLLSGTEIAEMPFTGTATATTTATQVSGWQIVVPANSGPAALVVGNALLAIVTGTIAANGALYGELKILDELSNQIALGQERVYCSGTSNTQSRTVNLLGDVANQTIDKTYSVWLRTNTVSGSSAVTLNSSAGGFSNPVLKAIRR